MSWTDELDGLNGAALDTFGETVTYDPAGATAAFSLAAIVEDPSRLTDVSPGVFVVLYALSSAFAAPPAIGDTATVRSVTCRVVNVNIDLTGMYSIALARR